MQNGDDKRHEAGELSDAELNGVAGGYSWNDFTKDVGGAANTVVSTGQNVVNTVVNTGQQAVNHVVDTAHEAHNVVTQGVSNAAQGYVVTGQAAVQFATQQAFAMQEAAQKQAQAAQEAAEKVAKAAQQKAEQEAQNAAKNPAGTAAQFSGVGLINAAVEQMGGKTPKIPNMPTGGPLSGGTIIEAGVNIVKGGGVPKVNVPNPLDGLPNPFGTPGKPQPPGGNPKIETHATGPKIAEVQQHMTEAQEQKAKLEEKSGKPVPVDPFKAAQQAVQQAQQEALKATQKLASLSKPFGKS